MMECMFVLLIWTAVIMAAPSVYRLKGTITMDEAIEDLSFSQLTAIRENDYYTFENDNGDYEVRFNRRGNVMHAETIHLDAGNLIVSLGTGRFYEKP